MGAGGDHPGSISAMHQWDVIAGGWARETGACLDVGVRDSGVIVTFSYTWNRNAVFLFLITWLKGLLLDVWPTPPQRPGWDWAHEEEWLVENLLLHEVGLASPGLLWRPALAMCQASSWHNSFMHFSCCWHGSTLGTSHTSPSKLVQQFSISQDLWTLKRSWWKGALGPSLQLSQLEGLGSAFSALSSSWRLYYGAGAPARRDPIPGIRWYLSLGVLFSIHWDKADPRGSDWQPCLISWSSGCISSPAPLSWWNSHNGEWLILPSQNIRWAF